MTDYAVWPHVDDMPPGNIYTEFVSWPDDPATDVVHVYVDEVIHGRFVCGRELHVMQSMDEPDESYVGFYFTRQVNSETGLVDKCHDVGCAVGPKFKSLEDGFKWLLGHRLGHKT